MHPPLKWAGGKRWLLPHIEPIWRSYEHRRLVEPFCGGLAVSLGLQPEEALLNDINPHAINFYQWLKKGLIFTVEMRNDKVLYYEHRGTFNALVTSGQHQTQEAAELFYYLNRTGFNGLCRFNQKGEFNVPMGRYKTINYAQDFLEYQPILTRWKLSNLDFEAVPVQAGDIIYADPPYDVEFRQYSQWGFSWADQVRLAHWLAQLNNPVIVSNQATPRIIELYSGLSFNIKTLKAPRRISCKGDRSPALEMLAFRGL